MSGINPKKKKDPVLTTLDAELEYEDSVDKILEQLPSRSEAAFRLYCQSVGRRHHHVEGSHSNALSHNLGSYEFEDVPHHYQSWSYHRTLPYMLNSSVKHLSSNDPVTELMTKKTEWRRRYMTMARWAGPLVDKYKRVNDNVAVAPGFLVKMAEHLKKDPDPHFDCGYNWYYTGHGNLTCVKRAGRDFVVQSVKNILYISELITDIHGHNIDFEQTTKFQCADNILETVCFEDKIALRTSQKVYLIFFNVNQSIHLKIINTFQTDLKYTSIAIDKDNLYLTHLDSNIEVVNLENVNNSFINIDITQEQINKWSCIRSIDSNKLLFAHKHGVILYDRRTEDCVSNLKTLKNISDPCNNITCIEMSHKTDYIYVGTNHHLLMADMRYLDDKNEIRSKFLARWNHGMKLPPIYLKLIDFECDKELICLNSQWIDDTTLVVNGFAEFSMIPYKPQSIFSTYNEAKSQKYCIDPILPLQERLVNSLTGCLLFENGENYELFIQNSLGDVSKQVFVPNNLQPPVEIAVFLLDQWSKQLYKNRKCMLVTDMIDISQFWRSCERVSNDLECYNVSNVGKSNYDEKRIVDFYNMDSMGEGLLLAWGINENNEITTEQHEIEHK